MKLDKLNTIIREEVTKSLLLNEIYDLDRVKYSPSVEKQVDGLVNVLQKSSNLSKIQVASILNDIIMALGLNRTQMTMYMNMIKQQRRRAQF
jgi:hypothetical protein